MSVSRGVRLLGRWPTRAVLSQTFSFNSGKVQHGRHGMVQTLPALPNAEQGVTSRQLGLGHSDSLLPFGAREVMSGTVDHSFHGTKSWHPCIQIANDSNFGKHCSGMNSKVRNFFASAQVHAEVGSPEKETATPSIPEPERKSIVWQSVLDLSVVPIVPLVLGLAGAIPFIALAPPIAPLLPLPEVLARSTLHAQAAYGACILTFLGAPHWGLAMANGNAPTARQKIASFTVSSLRYVWSVVPSLVAWLALLLDPVPEFAVLAASFAVVLGVDVTFARLGLVPAWYLPLRIPLSLIAIISLASSIPVAMALDTWSRLKAKPVDKKKEHATH